MKRKFKDLQELNLSKRDKICRKVIDYGLIALVIFSPLPAASVPAWSLLVIQLAVLVMTTAYFLMREKPVVNSELSASLRWPKFLFTGFFFFLFFQAFPFPRFIVKLLSPHAFVFRDQFSINAVNKKFMSFSLAPFHTVRGGLEVLTYVLLGFLIIRTVTHRHQIRRLFFVLVGMGFFEAFYGLFELYRNNPRLLFYKKDINLQFVTGTFVNQNHLSGYLEMIIPLAIGLVIARISLFSLSGKKIREKIILMAEKGLGLNLILTAFVVAMALAVALSRSRSGVFVVVLSFIAFFELSVLYFGRATFPRIKRIIQATFLLITVFSLYVGIGATLERFLTEKIFQGGRAQYWGNVTAIAGDFPLFGTGLGTFASVYPAYAQTETYGLLLHAHNDYLEYLSELGLVGALLLFGGICFAAVKTFIVWRSRQNPEEKGLALGGFVSIIAISVHSLTDFNLHIPANMVLFSVILSLTAVTTFHGVYRKSRTDQSRALETDQAKAR